MIVRADSCFSLAEFQDLKVLSTSMSGTYYCAFQNKKTSLRICICILRIFCVFRNDEVQHDNLYDECKICVMNVIN
jgi:hypothetical protein